MRNISKTNNDGTKMMHKTNENNNGGTKMKRSMTLEEAMQAGYRCTYPDRKPKALSTLCNSLGPEYHLAAFDDLPGVGKDIVIQRVIGGGYDVEIYNYHNGKCTVALWADYGTHTVDEVRNVPAGGVETCIKELVATYCPPDVCENVFE